MLDFSQLESISRLGKRKLFIPGEIIIFAGERSSSMFIVCSGKVSCQVEGTEIRTFSAGESFGDVAIYFDYMFRVFEEHATLLGSPAALSSL
jgi:signal-transduction protein with cAMP-binding, CBS, and nucleotidyltransferase domain